MRRGVLLALVAAPLLYGCSDDSYVENGHADQLADPATDQFADPATDQITIGTSLRILVLGDSLAAGYGLDDLNLAFPARLEAALRTSGHAVEILNAGISGDTTAGGRSRLDWSLAETPDGVIVELGGNDGLRAVDPDVTFDNLNAILSRLQTDGIPALLVGMMAPPNLGRNYGDQFFEVYERLAGDYDVVFYPFFLDGVAGDPVFNQPDRIHPNEAGVDVIVERIKPYVERLLKRAQDARISDPAS